MELLGLTLSTLLAGAVAPTPGAGSGTPSHCLPLYQAYQETAASELEQLLLRDCEAWYRAVRDRQAEAATTSGC